MSINNINYGTSSLNNNTGNENSAFGSYAAYNNLDGSCNTAVGSNSLFHNTIGSYNTSVGAGSLTNNDVGSRNTAVGSSALQGVVGNQSVGNRNTAVGAQALYSNTGDYNTGIGTYAALDITTGNYNTFLGANTTFYNTANTYEYSTALGYGAEITRSNQIMMGKTNTNVMIPGTAQFHVYNPDSYNDLSVVSKQYVDSVAGGLTPSYSCLCATTASINDGEIPSGSPPTTSTDDVTIANGDYVLVINQGGAANTRTNNVNNGLWIVNLSGQWSRPPNGTMSEGTSAVGDYNFIQSGTRYGSRALVQINISPTIVGTDLLQYTLFYQLNVGTGEGLNVTSQIDGKQIISVDSSLNFINYLDNSLSGTINIGAYTTNTIIGPTGGNGKPVIITNGITGATGSFTNISANVISFPNNKVQINGSTSQVGQGANAVAVGNGAGLANQGTNAVAIGINAGQTNQSASSVAIGPSAGRGNQGASSVAIGSNASETNQGASSVAIGQFAGRINQGTNAVAVGENAGSNGQGISAIAIGQNAGQTNQANEALAIGFLAGNFDQSANAIAIGRNAGQTSQNRNAIAIGVNSAILNQGTNSIAIGNAAGRSNQGTNAIAIGPSAGQLNQGSGSIAIGNAAGLTNQPANSIVINALSGGLSGATQSAFYAAPVRLDNVNIAGNMLNYNTSTSEISYTSNVFYNNGNLGIGTTSPTAPLHVIANSNTTPVNNGVYIYNQTNSANQHAICGMRVAGSSGGNAFSSYDVNGVIGWSTGIDNVDGDKFKIANTWHSLSTNTRMTIDGAGNVGIGTTSPSKQFSLGDNSSTQKLAIFDGGSDWFYGFGTNNSMLHFSAGTTNNANGQMVLTTAGRLGIGRTDPSSTLDVSGNMRINGAVSLTNTAASTSTTTGALIVTGGAGIGGALNVGGNVGFGINSNNDYRLDVSGNIRMQNRNIIWANNASGTAQQFLIPRENDNITYLNYGSAGFNIRNNGSTSRMFITDGGNVGIGTTTPGHPLDVIGTCRATTFVSGSDYRLKTNIKPLLRSIDDLKPLEYDLGEKHDMGFIAHEVQEVFPFLVHGTKDGTEMQSLNYTGFIALLVKEVQELKKENKFFKERFEQLEQKNK